MYNSDTRLLARENIIFCIRPPMLMVTEPNVDLQLPYYPIQEQTVQGRVEPSLHVFHISKKEIRSKDGQMLSYTYPRSGSHTIQDLEKKKCVF